MQTTREEIVDLIRATLRCDVSPVDDTYVFEGRSWSTLLLPVKTYLLDEIVETVGRYQMASPASAATSASYEVVVQAASRLYMTRALDEGIHLEDSQSGTIYDLGNASPAFLALLILKMREQVGERWRRNIREPMLIRERIRETPTDTLTVFRAMMRIKTLRMESSTPRALAAWKPYADAIFFHLGYNLDLSVMPQSGIDHLLEPSRIRGMRRTTVKELDPPRRHYVNDLVHHYQLGVSADSAMLKYLSYYHVAEHFFETIFQDELAEQVQQLITSPEFSYRRKQDIRSLIKRVSKAIQVRDEEVVINEQVALRLTLEKYVDLTRLLADLNQFDASLAATYANRSVGFSGGDPFDLSHHNEAEVTAALSRRIYKTRNALVHSKESAKGRFVPFAHDAELLPEVPLMRFVAEQIIVATSKMISLS